MPSRCPRVYDKVMLRDEINVRLSGGGAGGSLLRLALLLRKAWVVVTQKTFLSGAFLRHGGGCGRRLRWRAELVPGHKRGIQRRAQRYTLSPAGALFAVNHCGVRLTVMHCQELPEDVALTALRNFLSLNEASATDFTCECCRPAAALQPRGDDEFALLRCIVQHYMAHCCRDYFSDDEEEPQPKSQQNAQQDAVYFAISASVSPAS